VATSAKTGQGLDDLRAAVTERLVGLPRETVIRTPAGNGRMLAWIEQHATVLECTVDEGDVVQTVRLPERLIAEIPRLAGQGHVETRGS
jgi:50S ribosomal subunit-associated GTPase HflX